MPFHAYTIDDSIDSSSGSARVPEGDYLVEIAGCKPSNEDHDGEPNFQWTLRIAQGKAGVGRTLRYTTTMKEGAQFGLGRLLSAVGVPTDSIRSKTVTSYRDHQMMASSLEKALKGRPLGVMVADRDIGGGKYVSSISETYPAEEWTERARFSDRETVPLNGSSEIAKAPPLEVASATAPGLGNIADFFKAGEQQF